VAAGSPSPLTTPGGRGLRDGAQKIRGCETSARLLDRWLHPLWGTSSHHNRCRGSGATRRVARSRNRLAHLRSPNPRPVKFKPGERADNAHIRNQRIKGRSTPPWKNKIITRRPTGCRRTDVKMRASSAKASASVPRRPCIAAAFPSRRSDEWWRCAVAGVQAQHNFTQTRPGPNGTCLSHGFVFA